MKKPFKSIGFDKSLSIKYDFEFNIKDEICCSLGYRTETALNRFRLYFAKCWLED